MKRAIAIAFAVIIVMQLNAQTLTSGLKVCVPIIEERFDWLLYYGGNNGEFGGLSDYSQQTKSIPSNYSDCLAANQCVEVGASESAGQCTYTSDRAIAYYTARIMKFDTKTLRIKINDKVAATITLDKSFIRGGASANSIKISSEVDTKYTHNFYLDDVFMYSYSTDMQELKNAKRLIVVGTLTDNMISELQEIVKANSNLTSIDLNSVTGVSGKMDLQTANPNCLIYEPSDYVSNTANVVKTTTESTLKYDIINNYSCDNLVITEGYPFDAMYSFEAVNASYNREYKSMANGYMSTVCLPFTVDLAQTGVRKAYSFTSYEKKTTKISFKEVETLEACMPYVIETSSLQPFMDLKNVSVLGTTPLTVFESWKGISKDDWTEKVKCQFHGTFTKMDAVKSDEEKTIYGFQEGKFVYVGNSDDDAVTFKPFRTYFTLAADNTAASARELYLDGVVNGINDVKAKQQDTISKVYGIDGTVFNADKLDELPTGIYVKGNKKILIK